MWVFQSEGSWFCRRKFCQDTQREHTRRHPLLQTTTAGAVSNTTAKIVLAEEQRLRDEIIIVDFGQCCFKWGSELIDSD